MDLRLACWLAALAVALTTAGDPAQAAPKKLWEVKGLEAPESALPVPAQGFAYVGSMAGDPTTKDGNGFISKISLDGKMITPRWATGLDAPKGMALVGNRLYVADIDKLVAIDTESGKIAGTYVGKDAKFFNDVAADGEGHVYVSDTGTNTIWRLADGRFESWLVDTALTSPNGLLVREGTLLVAGFGDPGRTAGEMVVVSLADKKIAKLEGGGPTGNLDGLEALANGGLLVSDWIKGALYRVDAAGKAELLLDLNQGSADIGYIPGDNVVLIPMMKDNLLAAYKLD